MKRLEQCTAAERLARGQEMISAANAEILLLEGLAADLKDDLARVEARINAHLKGVEQLKKAVRQLAEEVQQERA